jgi:hypothetical protein
MAAIYSNGGNRWNILGFNFTKRDALSSVYKISMVRCHFDSHSGQVIFSLPFVSTFKAPPSQMVCLTHAIYYCSYGCNKTKDRACMYLLPSCLFLTNMVAPVIECHIE